MTFPLKTLGLLSMVYAGVMIINSLSHNLVTLATGRYFDGFAGGYTGIALILTGLALIYYLRRTAKTG